jgi:hypothetical protein
MLVLASKSTARNGVDSSEVYTTEVRVSTARGMSWRRGDGPVSRHR